MGTRRKSFLSVMLALAVMVSMLAPVAAAAQETEGPAVLVFHGTEGTGSDVVDAAVDLIEGLGDSHGFEVDATADTAVFDEEALAAYRAVVFLAATGDELDGDERTAFEDYIGAGGGFLGVHDAAAAEPNWDWFGDQLIGTRPASSPSGVQDAIVERADGVHPASRDLPLEWEASETWLSFDPNPSGDVHTLLRVRERSYDPGDDAMGADHPIAWCHDLDAGRSVYTGVGSTVASYEDDAVVSHLTGALLWAAGLVRGDCQAAIDANYEATRLTESNASGQLDQVGELHGLSIADDGRVFYIGRGGGVPPITNWSSPDVGLGAGTVHVWDPATEQVTLAGTLEVFGNRGSGGVDRSEEGLVGIALDPDFLDNGWIYLHNTPHEKIDADARRAVRQVSRFTLDHATNTLDMDSEEVLLEWEVQIERCCHAGGDMKFDSQGNLYVATGDTNSSEFSGGYAGNHPGVVGSVGAGPHADARRTSGNTNDLNGKILRITPTEDGGYTIPEGNLFPPAEYEGEPALPEIYVMGTRNPSRMAIDLETDFLYSGVVGPDAGNPSTTWGPAKYDWFSVHTEAGNQGWPFCMGDRQPYRDRDEDGNALDWYDCENLVNDSPNNTGLTDIPPQNPQTLWYSPQGGGPVFERDGDGVPTYQVADQTLTQPYLNGGGGQAAMGGPIYRYDEDADSDVAWPAYWDGKWLIGDFYADRVRNAVVLDPDTIAEGGAPTHAEDLRGIIPTGGGNIQHIHGWEFGPDGALYVLDYGAGAWFNISSTTALWRVQYVGDEPTPSPTASATPDRGDAPLEVQFSSQGSGGVSYAWDFGDGATSTEANPTHTYTDEGAYLATLTVTYADDEQAVIEIEVLVGDLPEVTLDEPAQGGMFDWGDELPYDVTVDASEEVVCEQVEVGFEVDGDVLDEATGCEGLIGTGQGARSAAGGEVTARYATSGGEGLPGDDVVRVLSKHQQAEDADGSSGTSVTSHAGAEGGARVTGIDDGDWLRFDDVNLADIDTVIYRVSSPGLGGVIELRSGDPDGEVVSSVEIGSTEDGDTYGIVSAAVEDPGGTNDLYVTFHAYDDNPGGADLFDLDALYFYGDGVADPESQYETILDGTPETYDQWEITGPGDWELDEDEGLVRTLPVSQGCCGMLWYPEQEYEDFVLKLEWRDDRTDGAFSNSGVFVRFPEEDPDGDDDQSWTAINQGHEIQIYDGPTGEPQKSGSIYNHAQLNLEQAQPTEQGTWNDYEIRVVNQVYTVVRNGEVINRYENTSAARGLSGYIGLQWHDEDARLSFRNVRVKEVVGPEGGLLGAPRDPGTGPGLPQCPGDLSDEFDGDELDRDRWTTVVREGDGEIRVEDGRLLLPTNVGDLFPDSDPLASNLVFQPIPDDAFLAEAEIIIDGTEEGQQTGVMFYGDDDNWAKIAYKRHASQDGIEFIRTRNGEIDLIFDEDLEFFDDLPDTFRFRLESDGTDIWATYSLDQGSSWESIGRIHEVEGVDPPQIGVFALSDPAAEVIDAAFEYFHLFPDPTAGTPDPDDDFEGSALDTCRWSNIVREDPDNYEVSDGALRITTVEGDLWGGANDAVNIITQPVPDGAFEATVELTFEPTEGSSQAGMIVYGDDDNYAKLGRLARDGAGWFELIEELDGEGRFTEEDRTPDLPGDFPETFQLRMSVDEDQQVTGAYSIDDGETWVDVGRVADLGAMGELYVGVFAFTNDDDFVDEAAFHWFRLDAETDQPVHPVTAILDPADPDGDNGWWVSPVQLTLEHDDDDAALQWRQAGEPDWTDYDDPVVFDEDGEYELEYRVADGSSGGGDVEDTVTVLAGVDGNNFSPDEVAVAQGGTVVFEANAPTHNVILYDSEGEEVGSGGDFTDDWTYEFSADEVGVFTFACQPHPDMTGTLEVVGDGDGGNGGDGEVGEVSLRIDQTPPSTDASLDGETDDGAYVGSAALTLDAQDATSGVAETHWREAGDTDHDVYDGAVSFTDDGEYTIEYRSVDVAGNVEDWQEISFEVVDGEPPVDECADIGLPADQISIQLWTLNQANINNVENLTSVLDSLEDFGYRTIEPFGQPYSWISAEDFRELAADRGIRVVSSHGDQNVGQFPDTVAYAVELGQEHIGAGGPPGNFDTFEATMTMADTLNTLGEIAVDGGIDTGIFVHNHQHEFLTTHVDPDDGETKSVWELLVEYTNPDWVSFQLDVWWAAVGEHDPAQVIEEYGDRIHTLHIKDGILGPNNQTFLGEGDLDFKEILETAIANDVQYFMVERDPPGGSDLEDSLAFVEHGFEFLDCIELDLPTPSFEVGLDPTDPDGDDGWYVSPVTLTLASDDPGAELAWRHEGDEEWTAYTDPVVFDDDGIYTIEVQASGTGGSSSETVSFQIDTTPPETDASLDGTQSGGAYVGEATLTLDASDATSGVAETHWRILGDDHLAYDGPVVFDEPGTYTVEYRSIDVAGNVEDWQTVDFEVIEDDGPPPPESVCARHQGGASFPDASGSGHRFFIDCLAELRIVGGFTDGLYRPAASVTRGQLASFVVRAIETATGDTLEAGGALFPDVSPGSTHGQAIYKLRNAGIIQGFADGTFRPAADVSRDQTARYVVNALELVLGEELATSGARFPDVTAGQYVVDIDKLVTAGVVSGFTDGTFGPRQPVTRGQMARFVANALEVLNDNGAYHGP